MYLPMCISWTGTTPTLSPHLQKVNQFRFVLCQKKRFQIPSISIICGNSQRVLKCVCLSVCVHMCVSVYAHSKEVVTINIKKACCYLVKKFDLGYESLSKQNILA